MSALHRDLMAVGVDVVSTLQRFDGNEALLVRCLRLFAADDSSQEAEAALATGDYERLGAVAHAIKGTSGNVGLAEVSESWNRVLQAVREERLEDVEALCRTALAELAAARQGIEAL